MSHTSWGCYSTVFALGADLGCGGTLWVGGSSCSTWQLAEDGGEGMGPLQRFYHIWGLLQLHLLAASRTQAFMGNKGVWPGKTPPPLLLPSPPSSAAPEAGHLLLPQAAGISLHFFLTITSL